MKTMKNNKLVTAIISILSIAVLSLSALLIINTSKQQNENWSDTVLNIMIEKNRQNEIDNVDLLKMTNLIMEIENK